MLNDEARNLLTFLSAPERQGEGFSTAIDAQVNLLTSSIGNIALSNEQGRTMQDLADLLSPICERSSGELATQCSRQWRILGSSGLKPDSPWNEAMANYKGWRDPAAVLRARHDKQRLSCRRSGGHGPGTGRSYV